MTDHEQASVEEIEDAVVEETVAGHDADVDPGSVSDEVRDDTVDDVQSDGEDADHDADFEREELDPLELEGELAADYLEELLDIADLDGDIDTYTSNGRAHVSIDTDSDLLVGKDGEVLDALQELARLAVMTETGSRSRMMLDIAGFREHRRIELRALAEDACTEVKATGDPVRLNPMNPFERKIVHDVVADNGLHSESEGEEPERRVVISVPEN